MERTVPSTGSDEIELYQRTYYSLLRSTAEVRIRSLEEAHAGTNSLLHPAARGPGADMSAFIYSVLRLPACIFRVQLVVLGQSADVFARKGYGNVTDWEPMSAVARRRRCFFDRESTLACFISSRTDIDDILPLLTAYQMERNKFHLRLQAMPEAMSLDALCETLEGRSELAKILEISLEDLNRLQTLWGDDFLHNMSQFAMEECDLHVKLLNGSLIEYRRATNDWWENIERAVPELHDRPVYFVSSNTHSLINSVTGFAFRQQDELLHFLDAPGRAGLLGEWRKIQNGKVCASQENFLYYVLKKYQQSPEGAESWREQMDYEQKLGIRRVSNQRSFDIEAQVIDLARLHFAGMDPRLQDCVNSERLAASDALILNIDYPLGLTAFDVLSEVASQVGSVLGVYVMGKAATLNAAVGDVLISGVVHDEHSANTYLFSNSFTSADVAPDLKHGTVLDNQKSVTVQGTFLQNASYMDVFYREGYTVIEMEAGPYLSALYEMTRPKRHPVNEIINLYGIPYDVGILHYASDTPLGKGKNLGAGSLSYYGMDSTYAVTLAILRRIFRQEQKRL